MAFRQYRFLLLALYGLALPAAASAVTLDFRITLDAASALPGTVFVQSYNAGLHQGDGSYIEFGDGRIEEKRSVFGAATAQDNAPLVALQTAYGTTGYGGFDTMSVKQTIYDNRFDPKNTFFLTAFRDYREADIQIGEHLFEIGFLDIRIDGTASTDDPASPLSGFYLDTNGGLRTALRYSNLRYSAVGGRYRYDDLAGQVVGPVVFTRYDGTAAFLPEPGSWALLITGFGLTGAVMRRRRSLATA